MKTIKPNRLKPGDRIAIVSPSWGGPFHFPKLLDVAVDNLSSTLDVEVIEFPTARADSEYLYRNPKVRAEDINRAFEDPSINGIISSIGGNDSIRILEYLDTDVILKNPKIIVGYSDAITILAFLNTHGLVTFHGPTMLAGWAQIKSFRYLTEYYQKAFQTNDNHSEIKPFPDWSNGYPNWIDETRHGQVLSKQSNAEGHVWLQGEGFRRGKLWGGCIEVIDFLKGTRYWPEGDFWKDKILFFETSEEKPSPSQVKYSIRNLGVQGILNRVQGIFVGRAKDYSQDETKELYKVLTQVVSVEFGATDLPIIANMSFGHTDPNLVLPYGILHEIDSASKTIRRIEPVFSD